MELNTYVFHADPVHKYQILVGLTKLKQLSAVGKKQFTLSIHPLLKIKASRDAIFQGVIPMGFIFNLVIVTNI